MVKTRIRGSIKKFSSDAFQELLEFILLIFQHFPTVHYSRILDILTVGEGLALTYKDVLGVLGTRKL